MGERNNSNIYPFSAIVGQNLLKKALLLNAIDPDIGGVLIRGERGTAKSTAVRSLAALLPEQKVIIGCPYNCDPIHPETMCSNCFKNMNRTSHTTRMKVVELPVSATEDKVVGTLDISAAIKNGEKKFEPGILAEANRNILYVDEVNLLNDHIVDVLLDSAAMGINTVEREGISFSHPSKFILIGTMNPEEGDLRPQLLDRFGLCVNIEGISDPDNRITILERIMSFSSDPAGFNEKWKTKDEAISQRVYNAEIILRNVHISDDMLRLIIEICIEAHVDGHRGDIAMVKTSKAIAAYEGRTEVEEKDVRLAAVLVLSHRSKDPPEYSPPPEDEDQDEDQNDENDDDEENDQQNDHQPQPDNNDEQEPGDDDNRNDSHSDSSSTTEFKTGEEFSVKHNSIDSRLRIDSVVRDSGGRRTETESNNGRYVGYRMPRGKPTSIALDATLRAAALHQSKNDSNMALKIESQDIREKVKERKMGNLIVFVVDASGSMGAQQRMIAVKGAISSLLTDAYQKRDRVSLIVFRGTTAEIVLPPTNSIVLAKKSMDEIPTGGKTPLGDGLIKAHELITKEQSKDPKIRPMMVVVSDGRGNVSRSDAKPMDEISSICLSIRECGYPSLVLDSEMGMLTLGFAKKLADKMDAKYLKLEDLRADTVSNAIGIFSSTL
ncbi:MAG: putative cobaltochelatase [Candidatus Methanogranum gryphiswaldense]|nr:MAG: putative cobaltochelatase [Candidatus Methanogranum sp. U3.2.1]